MECGVSEEAASKLRLSYSALEEATRSFNPGLKIGEGSYGSVFRAQLHGTAVAVKRLDKSEPGEVGPMSTLAALFYQDGNEGNATTDGGQAHIQFNNEIRVLSKYQHPNIVQLLGYSVDGPTRCLVYDLMESGSLEDRLACKGGTPALPWFRRVHIAHQAVKGLAYLHKAAGCAHRCFICYSHHSLFISHSLSIT